jgi:lysophospholipase L1-like esterase
MPVGDSITAGEHYKAPPLEERTGYRKALYEMLVDGGYRVDFVGSQKHGIRPKTATDWYDWNNEAYPGKGIVYIAQRLQVGLGAHRPDVLLIHVGTNGRDWSDKPQQVKDMLDMINRFSVNNDHPITVLLCAIINRYRTEDPAPTTRFNNDVAEMLKTRSGDKIKIVWVDMERGAGLDYSDAPPDPVARPPYEGGDMLGTTYPGVALDKYHPNDKGNAKMAAKFYHELVREFGEAQ